VAEKVGAMGDTFFKQQNLAYYLCLLVDSCIMSHMTCVFGFGRGICTYAIRILGIDKISRQNAETPHNRLPPTPQNYACPLDIH
jgi:hypothetical protein